MDSRQAIPEIIRRRKSVRTYREEPVPGPLLDSFRASLEAARQGPLGSFCRFALFDVRTAAGSGLSRMGTYGMIRGARLFFSGAVRLGAFDLEDFGYLFETQVLKATGLGLGTCWLGASFDRRGYGRLLQAALCREMVRLAPSARNRQPWRIVKQENRFHFFLRRSLPPGGAGGLDLARVDLGIAMCHFDLTARHLGLAGGFVAEKPDLAGGPALEYTITWKGASV
jgi:hypothetical protein